ncbi:DUF6220 domain-containing protein [Natrinema soli]|uniref:DUF6220 domain-containing protein n=1 Tax=Natrinema soli TaxID=1930624 RepID=A0ABD5SFM8_9EURY|nr:DUF6220 domain-containing protein [Natrinema soli]
MTASERPWGRYGYCTLAGLFAACVLVQTYIAGMAIFVDPANWGLHRTFIHLFEIVPILMVLVAFLGRLSWPLRLFPIGLFALISVQYATAHAFGSMATAIHPVVAVVIFWLAVVATKRSWPRSDGAVSRAVRRTAD